MYQGRGVSGADFCLWVIPGLLIPAGLILAGLSLTVDGSAPNGLSTAGRPWLCTGLVLLIPFAVIAYRRFQAIHTEIAVHQNGLHLVGIAGKSIRLGWDEIEAVYIRGTRRQFFGRPISDRYALTLVTGEGRSFHIPDRIADLDKLAETIRLRIEARLRSGIMAKIDRGEAVDFGPVAITTAGLRTGRRNWTWDDVDAIRIANGSLMIESGGSRVAIPASEIPNTTLLLDLAARFGSGPGNL